jgi:hypothetical protein
MDVMALPVFTEQQIQVAVVAGVHSQLATAALAS